MIRLAVVILLLLQVFGIIITRAGMTFGLLFLVMVILGVIIYQGNRLKILMKMGLRNVNRRKVNTLIVVFGLMIGTAIISGSLVVGDTLPLTKAEILKAIGDPYLQFVEARNGCCCLFCPVQGTRIN